MNDLDSMASVMLINRKVDELLDLHAKQEQLIAQILQGVQDYLDLFKETSNFTAPKRATREEP